jgi:predicted metal-binding membrane protein
VLDYRASTAPARVTRGDTAIVATLGVAAACWVLAVRRMSGMDMGVATDLGSLGFFVAAWVPMMAAMMLPGTLPALGRRTPSLGIARGVPSFLLLYIAAWSVFGLAVYAVYRPHGTTTAGVLVIATGLYELTPLKAHCRRRCQQTTQSGEFTASCVGSSIGLMVALVALGVMSIAWMSIVAALVLAQKILPARRVVDVPVALAIVAFGVLVLTAPHSIPGLVPSM